MCFVSLRVAAMHLNPRNAFHGGTCNCKASCKTKRCPCRRKGFFCTSKCHQGRMCKNCSQDEHVPEDHMRQTLTDADFKSQKNQEVKAVTSYNVSESSNDADLKMRLRSSVDYLCIGDIQANKTCWEKELTKEQRDRVLLKATSTKELNVTPGAGVVVYPSDWRLLVNGKPLSGEVIDCLLSIFAARAEEQGHRQVYIIDNHFLSLAEEDASVESWLSPKLLDVSNLILTAANVNGNHWCLAGIDVTHQQIFYFDPLKRPGCKRHLDILRRIVHCHIFKDPPQSFMPLPGWTVLEADHIQNFSSQSHGVDCGVFTIMYGLYKICDADHDFKTADMPQIRWWLALIITDCANILSKYNVIRRKKLPKCGRITIEEDLEDEIVWPSYSEVAHAIDVDKEYLCKIVSGEVKNEERDLVLMNQCTGSKLKEMKLLQFNSLGKSLDHYSSEELCDLTYKLDEEVARILIKNEEKSFRLSNDVLFKLSVMRAMKRKNPERSNEEIEIAFQ